MDTVEEYLRQAIKDSGLTQGQLSRATGVPQPTLSLFLGRKSGLGPANTDRLLEFFGAEVAVQPKPQKPSTSVPLESPRTVRKEGKPPPTSAVLTGPDFLSMPVASLPERCWRKLPGW